jgi:hypothetical protein
MCPDIPVTVVQNTFTHKQYIKQQNETEYTEWDIHNYEKMCTTFIKISPCINI